MATTTEGASLTSVQVLCPPNKSFGGQLQYASGSAAWQCAFSKDGQYLAACFGPPDLVVRVWRRLGNGEWTLDSVVSGIHERTIRSIAFAPLLSPLILASASFDGSVSIWEKSTTSNDSDGWECAAQLEGHDNEVKGVAWNATGSLLATCSRDKSVWIWECFLAGTVGASDTDIECIAVLNGHEGDVKQVQFAPSHGILGDGEEIVLSASYDDTIKCWAEDCGEWFCAASIANVHTSTIWALTVAPGGGRVISCSADGSLGILKFDATAGAIDAHDAWKCVGKLPDAHHKLPIYDCDYAPAKAGHGRIVTAGGDDRIQIYREALGSTSDRPLFSLDASVVSHDGDVNSVCWHPHDGSLLASCGDDGTVRIWKYKTGV
ncbi:sulfur protein assembly protein [Seminavis robusta]|uniref:Probable cytosolic iron-sulfur protein assembly protein CIAO1 homolog n=1 Tax=Seminavis robusta TaxID=568900 RepID=A0A9N8DZN7_9STRA|nr:sulfur protein assembly protein [Seminavis robusta]|eukprot:Sro369_g128140.1 sulfur protein assembly protein (377) ;mRNA; r:21599-22729